MTREEKISHLKGILSEINENDNAVCYLTSEDNELIESAIEALEQQPCEDCISREQAVDAVADLFEMSEYPHPYPQGKPIRLKDIKEKLKQLPSVQPKPIECSDVISREQAIDALHMCLSTNSYDDDVTGDSYICYEEAEYEIEKLPSVQPKPKTGHWEPMWYDGYADGCPVWEEWDCSECGYEHNGLEDTLTNYCPNCGAKMESEES